MHPLAQLWRHWARQRKPCCGLTLMKYVPGCTYIECDTCRRKVAVPDWDPRSAVQQWNQSPS